MIEIKEFDPAWQLQVVEHILAIENHEFNMGLSIEAQPDIADINAMYRSNNGNFWIALNDGNVIGTIGIYFLAGTSVELRRMFVKPEFRGKEWGIGQQLLDIALRWTKSMGYTEVFLETTEWLVAAGKFYTKNNFRIICKEALPANLPVLRSSGQFMKLELAGTR